MQFAQAGDPHTAARHFAAQAATGENSQDGWSNLANAMIQLSDASKDPETMLACRHAVSLAIFYAPTSAEERRKLTMIDELLRNADVQVSATTCSDHELHIVVAQEERDFGALQAINYLKAHRVMADCGLVVLDNAFDSKLISTIELDQASQFDDYYNEMLADKSQQNTTESNRRGVGRYELKVPMRYVTTYARHSSAAH